MDNLQWLANFGFAAVVAGYVLMRLEPAIKELNKTVTLLTIVVARMSGQDYDTIRREFMNGGPV
jgi:hypothetical protein